MPPTILLADDNASTRRMLGQYLTDLGCTLVTAAFGEAAWRALRATPPDLVMIDADLPGIGGLEFCRRMRARPESAATPLLLLVGALSEAAPTPPGVTATLRKPVTEAALAAALQDALGEAVPLRVATAPPRPLPPPKLAAPATPATVAAEAAPPTAPPAPAREDDADLLRRVLGAHLPGQQVEIIVREWERRRATRAPR